MVPAMYIQVAGGLNLAALKKPSVAGSVNLPTMCGMKNSAQIRRRTTIPLSRLNLSAHDMLSPVDADFGSFQWIALGRRKAAHHPIFLLPLSQFAPKRVELVGLRPIDARHVLLHLVADLGLQIGEVAVAHRKARQQLRIELRRLGGIDRDDLVLLVGQAAPAPGPTGPCAFPGNRRTGRCRSRRTPRLRPWRAARSTSWSGRWRACP